MKKVVLIQWTEHERGWGCRPDGCSLYNTPEEAQSHINTMYAQRDRNHVPDEYSSPDFATYAYINEPSLLNKFMENANSPFWLFNTDYNKHKKDESLIVTRESVPLKM